VDRHDDLDRLRERLVAIEGERRATPSTELETRSSWRALPTYVGRCFVPATPTISNVDNMLDIHPLEKHRIDDLTTLFATDQTADRCWCMWFITAYKDFHAAGRNGNRALLITYTIDKPDPMGLIAYNDGQPVGWCAVGPRSRYTRAVKTPTMKQRSGDDDTTWLVPCFFVHPDHRNAGIAAALLDAAVALATTAGAKAIQGFPLAGSTRRTSGSDLMTGNEDLFNSAGFDVESRPSSKRSIMNLDLT
jgi:GNAT superfamily N-acetyltransferase